MTKKLNLDDTLSQFNTYLMNYLRKNNSLISSSRFSGMSMNDLSDVLSDLSYADDSEDIEYIMTKFFFDENISISRFESNYLSCEITDILHSKFSNNFLSFHLKNYFYNFSTFNHDVKEDSIMYVFVDFINNISDIKIKQNHIKNFIGCFKNKKILPIFNLSNIFNMDYNIYEQILNSNLFLKEKNDNFPSLVYLIDYKYTKNLTYAELYIDKILSLDNKVFNETILSIINKISPSATNYNDVQNLKKKFSITNDIDRFSFDNLKFNEVLTNHIEYNLQISSSVIEKHYQQQKISLKSLFDNLFFRLNESHNNIEYYIDLTLKNSDSLLNFNCLLISNKPFSLEDTYLNNKKQFFEELFNYFISDFFGDKNHICNSYSSSLSINNIGRGLIPLKESIFLNSYREKLLNQTIHSEDIDKLKKSAKIKI